MKIIIAVLALLLISTILWTVNRTPLKASGLAYITSVKFDKYSDSRKPAAVLGDVKAISCVLHPDDSTECFVVGQ